MRTKTKYLTILGQKVYCPECRKPFRLLDEAQTTEALGQKTNLFQSGQEPFVRTIQLKNGSWKAQYYHANCNQARIARQKKKRLQTRIDELDNKIAILSRHPKKNRNEIAFMQCVLDTLTAMLNRL